jgi:hypothetical protein
MQHRRNSSRLFARNRVPITVPFSKLLQSKGTTVLLTAALFLPVVAAPSLLQAQQLIASNSPDVSSTESTSLALPDAPSAVVDPQSGPTPAPIPPQQTDNPDAVSANGTQQTKRVLGIVPNFRSVSAGTKLPPLSPKQKFILAGKDTFDYSSLFVAGIQAGFSMNSKSYPEFHQGVDGYARYYWHTLADTASENFMVGGAGPIIFHQDNRFYTLGHGGFRKRTFYAVTRVLVTRQDSGKQMFNFSEVMGSGAAAGLSTVYYPKQYQTWTKVGQKWLTSDLIDCFNFFWKEYWPDVNKKLFHTD